MSGGAVPVGALWDIETMHASRTGWWQNVELLRTSAVVPKMTGVEFRNGLWLPAIGWEEPISK